jgi:lysophospholipase L1-like esterase
MNKQNINPALILIIFLLSVSGCKVKTNEPITNIAIPQLENFKLDGNPEEWKLIESYRLWSDPLAQSGIPSDINASCKVAWNRNSLLLFFNVSDDSFVGDTVNPWNGDAIEIFLAPFRGSVDILQYSIISFKEKDFVRVKTPAIFENPQVFSGNIKSASCIHGNLRTTEVEITFLPENSTINTDKSFAVQFYIDDADTGKNETNKLVWYPVGQSYNFSSSMFTIKCFLDKQTKLPGSSRLIITDNKKINLFVFGADKGDKIGIYKNGKLLNHYKSNNVSTYLPDSFDISSFNWDIENDSLFVTINDESLCIHELLLSPRLYKETKIKRFDEEIRNFIFMDRQSFPPDDATLFIGSSSIVRWETLKKDFPELVIIKRGFGGSTSPEALMYINQIALPYKPSKIVYYEGDNDIPMGFSPEEIRDNVKAFIEKVAESLPGTKVYIISPKPSVSRMHLWEKYAATHLLLRELAQKYDFVVYVDVSSPMFKKNGKLNDSLFVEDGIHMNADGYAIWTMVIKKAMGMAY